MKTYLILLVAFLFLGAISPDGSRVEVQDNPKKNITKPNYKFFLYRDAKGKKRGKFNPQLFNL